MKFDKIFKIYIFKEKNRVNLSLRASDSLVIEYRMNVEHMKYILENWKNGTEIDTGHNVWLIEYKKYGPRPERKYGPYVRISVNHGGIKFHYRLSYDDMLHLERDFYYQINNMMYWDKNV